MKTRETEGMLLGLIGVVIFSLTLPMTRIVVAEIHPALGVRSSQRFPPCCCSSDGVRNDRRGRRSRALR